MAACNWASSSWQRTLQKTVPRCSSGSGLWQKKQVRTMERGYSIPLQRTSPSPASARIATPSTIRYTLNTRVLRVLR